MSKFTIADVGHIVPQDLTPRQIQGVEDYLNLGTIPPADPCGSCEPNFIRKLISLIQVAERNGLWPPKREVTVPATTTKRKAKSEPDYVAGTISDEEIAEIKEARPNLFDEEAK